MTGRGRNPGPLRAMRSLSSCAGVEREVTSRSVLCSVPHTSAPRCLLTARLPPGGRHAHSLSRFEGATLITPCPLGLPSLGESAFPGVGEWGEQGLVSHVSASSAPHVIDGAGPFPGPVLSASLPLSVMFSLSPRQNRCIWSSVKRELRLLRY